MSLLLDALDRADKERGQQVRAPSSPTSSPTSEAKEVRIKRWILEALIGSLLLGLVLYALFFRASTDIGDTTAATRPTESLPLSESSTPSEVALPETPIVETPPQAANQLENTNNLLVDVAEQVSTSSVSDNRVSALYQQQNNHDALIGNIHTQPSPAPPANPSNALPQASAVVSNNIPERESNNFDSTETFFQQVPLLSDLPTQFKRRVPNLKYSTHVFNKGTQTGFVNLNGPFREVGSQIAPGIKLIAILPEGVVLELDGTLFRLRALNDCVAY